MSGPCIQGGLNIFNPLGAFYNMDQTMAHVMTLFID